jgi:hypothetical protein
MPIQNMKNINTAPMKISRPVMSDKPFHFSLRGPKQTFCIMLSKKTAVTTNPIVANEVTSVTIGNYPLKTRNSPTKPFKPGKPRDENIEIPSTPA